MSTKDAEGGAGEAQDAALTSGTVDAQPTSAPPGGTSALGVLALVAGLLGVALRTAALVTAQRR